MTVPNPAVAGRRLLWDTVRMVRRFARQAERRMRYRRLGWV